MNEIVPFATLVPDIILKGGPVVAILLVLSVLAMTVALLKWGQFLAGGIGTGRAARRSSRDGFQTSASGTPRNPTMSVVKHVMDMAAHGHNEPVLREEAERVGMMQLARMRSGMRFLDLTVQVAPLIGLFGTVVGMINAFQSLQTTGAATDPSALAGGIWVALLTTAVGLAVAIPLSFVTAWFEARIEREKLSMETVLTQYFTARSGPVERVPADDGATLRAAE